MINIQRQQQKYWLLAKWALECNTVVFFVASLAILVVLTEYWNKERQIKGVMLKST
jgi:hypothetical protein